MKSLKVKLASIVSAFILALSLLIVGVWAVGQSQTITMEGSVNFNVADKSLYVKDVRMQEDNNSTPYSLKEQDKLMPGYINGNFNMDLGEFTNDYGTFALYFDIINTMDESTSETFEYTVDPPTQPSNGTATITILDNNGDAIDRIPQGTVKPSQISDSTQASATIKLTVSSTSSSQVDLSEIIITINQVPPEVYDYFTFEINEDNQTVTLTDYNPNLSDSADVVIPSTVSRNAEEQWIEGDTYTVTAITNGEPASGVFYNSGITSIELPSTLESIGDYAFYNCSGLTGELNLGECTSLTSIGVNAFYNCSSLTGELNLGKCTNLTSIGFAAFCVCSSLTSITLPEGLTSIEDYAFQGCSGLTSITLPDSIKSMGDGAFVGCDKLTSVDLSNCTSLASIGGSAFTECSGLTSITLPSSLTSIGYFAFSSCYALAEVYNYSSLTLTTGSEDNGRVAEYAKVVYNLSDGEEKPATRIQTIDNIQYYVYEDDFIALAPTSRDISSVNLASRTTEINQFAFRDCSGLTSITLPSSLTSIGNYAFWSCSGLTGTVTIPASVTEIGLNPFRSCRNLEGITVESGNSSYYDEGNCLIEKSTKTLIKGFNNSTIPSDIKIIVDYAFFACDGLTSITLPSSLTSIGANAFYGCTNLASVTFENTEGWKRSTSSSMTNPILVDVSAPSTNATYLKNTYVNYYWQRG